jgi:hypothetical protein
LLSTLVLLEAGTYAAEDVCEPVVDGIRFTCPLGGTSLTKITRRRE